MKFISEVSGKRKIYIFILLALQMITGASGVAYALLLRGVIDCAVDKDSQGFFWYVGALVGLIVLQLAFRAAIRYLEEKARATYENLFKGRLFDALLYRDYGSVTATHSGEWMNRLTSDTVVVADGLATILPGLGEMSVKMLGALAMILVMEPKFSYVLIPGGALLVVLTYGFRRILKRMHKSMQEADGRVRVYLQERLGSLMVVKAFAREMATADEAEAMMSQHKSMRMKKNHFSNLCNVGFGLAMNGGYVLGVIYCGWRLLHGSISYGTLMAIMQLIGQIQTPFANITGYLPKYYAMLASAERLREAEGFGIDITAEESQDMKTLYDNGLESIVLKRVGFTYQPPVKDGQAGEQAMPVVLNELDMVLKKGEFIAFTGPSGCGKSTVLKLLMCLYRPDEGELSLELKDGEEMPLDAGCRRLFAYVPQGNQLMSGAIRDIIAFGDKTRAFDEEDMYTALRIACAEEFVRDLEQGLDTLLGERGMGLSEGQMQRLAIARAIFSQRPILLLDEATSSLDSDTEKQVLDNIRSMTDNTVIIVTHRPAALKLCDREIHLDIQGENA